LKHSLIGQFIKFFVLIGQPNVSKHLWRDFDRTLYNSQPLAQLEAAREWISNLMYRDFFIQLNL